MAKNVEETQKKAPVIRAVDIGFGFTKYNKLQNNELVYDNFISLAPRSSKIESEAFSMMNERDTVVVSIDGSDYEIGPDSHLLETVDSTRTLNDQYINTTQYKALFYGALHYMNEDVIDLLVVGLPVSNFKTQSQKLKEIMTGTHKINSKKTIEVKNVLVVMQPMGALKYCLIDPALKDLDIAHSNNLIIDPGFFTFDFVMASGSKIIENKSDSPPGGVNRVLHAIAESISNKIGKKYENHNAIDKGLRKRKLKIAGKEEDLLEHIKNTKSIIESPIIYMKNIIGDGGDVDNILLAGGGASIFEKTIKEFYPDRDIIKLPDSNVINVKGYQAIGEEYFDKFLKELFESSGNA